MNTERTILVAVVLCGLFCASVEAQRPPPRVIAMGASTGGQAVFERVLVDLDRCAAAGWTIPPIVIVQHGQEFIDQWVEQNLPPLISQPSGLTIRLVPVPPSPPAAGETLAVNTVYFAHSYHHMGVVREDGQYKIYVSAPTAPKEGAGPDDDGWIPSVDYLFRHVADAVVAAGGNPPDYAVGYVLTGQKQDGMVGLQKMQQAPANNRTRVQDWDATGGRVTDVSEYFGNPSMPEKASPYADPDGTKIAGKIIMDLFPMIHPLNFSLPPGDVNFDSVFDSSDLVLAFQAGEFEDGEYGNDPPDPPDKVNNSTWTEGDWNGDREFTQADLDYAQPNYVGGSFASLPVNQQDALAKTLKALRDAQLPMGTLLELLGLTESDLDQL